MGWLLANHGLVAGLLGGAGSLVLAAPLLTDLVNRRHWDAVSRLRREGETRGITATEARALRDDLLDDILGNYRGQRFVIRAGLVLLVLAFALLVVGALAG